MKSTISHIAIHLAGQGQPSPLLSQEHDRALTDLTREGVFCPVNNNNDPFSIDLYIHDSRLVLDIKDSTQTPLPSMILSLSPYRRLIKDYFLMLESFEKMRREGAHEKLEAIDMGRRGLHNEAAEKMMDRLKDKIDMDLETARRLFTLICVLHLGQTRQSGL